MKKYLLFLLITTLLTAINLFCMEENGGLDKLAPVPSDCIHIILSFVPAGDVVKNFSLVSKEAHEIVFGKEGQTGHFELENLRNDTPVAFSLNEVNIKALKNFCKLKLKLINDPESLKWIGLLPNLISLELISLNLEGVVLPEPQKLKHLAICRCDNFKQLLKQCTNLKSLRLSKVDLTNMTIPNPENLISLEVYKCQNFDSEKIRAILSENCKFEYTRTTFLGEAAWFETDYTHPDHAYGELF